MGLVVVRLDRLALASGPRQTRDCDRLASQVIPAVLGLEEQPHGGRAQIDSPGSSRPDQKNERGESPLGSAPDSWGTAETRDQPLTSHRRQVHGPAEEASLAVMASIL